MDVSWPKYNREFLAIVFCILIIVGFVSSRAVMSIGMIALACNFILNTDIKDNAKKFILFPPFPIFGFIANTFVNLDIRAQLRKLWEHKEFLFLTFFFIIVLLSGLYSEDTADFWKRIRIKLPFLALPIALGALRPFNLKELKIVLYAFIAIIFVSGLVVLGNYIANYEAITDALKYGKAIPVPFNHIRFSLMMSFGVFTSLYFIVEHWESTSTPEKVLLGIAGIFLFILIHILSVRTGMLAIYAALFYYVVRMIIVNKKWLIGSAMLLCLIALPVLAYHFIPSVHNKINYMRYDLQMYFKGAKEDYSDTRRLRSIEVGMAVAKENWLVGVGAGDLTNEVRSYYKEHYPQIDGKLWKLPHNQFIYTMGSNGIIGLIALLLAFLVPLFYKRNYQNVLLTGFMLMILSSFMTEHTLEIQLGTAFCLTILVVILNYQKGVRADAGS